MSDAAASITQWAIGLLLGALGGSGGTFVALRTRLAKTDRDIVDLHDALTRHIAEEQAALERLNKRQIAMLKMTADIARKVGVDGRETDDALVRMLTEEAT